MKKRIVLFICAVMLLLGLTGCHRSEEPLPTEVANVGGIITKQEELLQPTEAEFKETLPYEKKNGLGLNEFNEDNLDVSYATVDDVKAWLAGIVAGEYSENDDAELEHIKRYSAAVKDGERIDIVLYDDVYYMTEYRLSPTTDDLSERIAETLTAYIGRRLASSESDELENAISAVLKGAEMGYLPALSNTANVYLILDGETFLVQMR